MPRRHGWQWSGRDILLRILTAASLTWLLGFAATLLFIAFRHGILARVISVCLAAGLVLACGWALAVVLALRNAITEIRRSAEEIADQSAVIAVNTSPIPDPVDPPS